MTTYFTFRSSLSTKRGVGFVASHLINMGLQAALVAVFTGIVGPEFALLPALAICVPVNFLLVRYCFRSQRFS